MKKETDKSIKLVIKKVTDSVENTNLSKLDTALTLHWAKNVIVWKLTDYRSWAGLCRVHVKLAMPTICNYVVVAGLVDKFGYTRSQCEAIIKVIGWHKFTIGMSRITKKLSVKAFIAEYSKYSTKTRKPSDNPDADRGYTFSLPAEQANTLDGYLIEYGMTTNPETGRRQGIRTAMMALIDNQLT